MNKFYKSIIISFLIMMVWALCITFYQVGIHWLYDMNQNGYEMRAGLLLLTFVSTVFTFIIIYSSNKNNGGEK